jgi:sec-independent protein translocase protein TatB
MFDVSFFELIVIVVVALVVIGPEKLPKVARTLGALTGRMQRYVAQVKEEVNREARFDELQKLQNEIEVGVLKTQSVVAREVDVLTHGLVPKDSPLVIQDAELENAALGEMAKEEQPSAVDLAAEKIQSSDATTLKKLVKKRVKKPSQAV